MARSKINQLFLVVFLVLFTGSLRPIVANSGAKTVTFGCFEEERKTLLEVKRSLGDPLPQLSSWTGEDCCNWTGVGCSDRTGHIVKLELSNIIFRYCDNETTGAPESACLRGELSPSLVNLTHLNYLDLSQNGFRIPIPSFIGSIQKLRYLDLSYSGSVGSVPPHLGNLSNLLYLDLSNNPFESSLPQWLFNISTLVTADFSNSGFTGSLPEIPLLKDLQLKYLSLQQNSLSGLVPPSIGNLFHLETLDLSENSVSGSLPTSLGNLFQLRTLDLSKNSISGPLPASIGNPFLLETLDLSENKIFGSLPMSVGNLSHLEILDLSFNMMSGSIPNSIGQLRELNTLNLWSNQWEGVISESHFQNLTGLVDLKLSSKSLAFNVSQEWVPSFNASFISIRDCQFASPAFPAWLKNQFIVSIVLSNVGISDTIPDWFWKFSPHIDWLDLSNNQLRGKLPNLEDFSAFVNLKNNFLEGSIPLWPNVSRLRLGSNRFSGPIPLNISQGMSTLMVLDLSRNNLSGSIPDSLTKLKSLSSIDLSRNSLSGRIPKEWNPQGASTIDFSNNNLSGQIPPSLCSQQSSLSWLRLRNNNLSGELGPSLQNCHYLYTLDLGGNKFSGAIPKWIGVDLSDLEFLLLGGNKFTGSIPRDLCRLSDLHVLDLSHNNLSGSIPRCLANWTQLTDSGIMLAPLSSFGEIPDMDPWHMDLDPKGVEYEYTTIIPLVNTIDLSSNNLSGEIPGELSKLSKLGSLNLSQNLLTGKIPEDIGSLQVLQTLDLSRNHLQGPIPMSMTNMTSLSILNLSYNDLSGPIPSANQFQTFNDPTLFEGNLGLCGGPLPTQCSPSPDGNPEVKEDEGSGKIWLYVSTTLGFILGFWAVFGSLVLKRSWRHAYFKFVDDMKDRLILIIIVKYMACVQRITKQEGQA